MRLLFTLIASGLLILTEIPAEQPPSTASYYTQVYAGSPSTYQGVPEPVTFSKANTDNVEAYQPQSVDGDSPNNSPDLSPADFKISPTPPTATALASSVMATYGQPANLPIAGYATYYNPNVMQQVLSYRQKMGQISSCNECVGTVALLRAGDINRRVWLQWSDGTIEGPFLVVDAAASQHVNQLIARNWVVDVDYRTAVRHSMLGPVWVTVWGAPPESSQIAQLPLIPLSYSPPVEERKEPPTPTPTVLSASASTSSAETTVHGGFPTETTVATITPLPPINNAPSATPTVSPSATRANTPTNTPQPTPSPSVMPITVAATPAAVTVVIGGFPTETIVPTITPLPALNATPTATPTSSQVVPTITPTNSPIPTSTPLPTFTPVPTYTPLPTSTLQAASTPLPTATPQPTVTPLPTSTLIPSATPLPALASPTPTNSAVVMGGFPTVTVAASITPLPPIALTATPSATTIAPTPTATLAATPTQTVALTPTDTPTTLPSPDTTATSTALPGGFPTETSVATITPLPAINPQSMPTP